MFVGQGSLEGIRAYGYPRLKGSTLGLPTQTMGSYAREIVWVELGFRS